MTCVGIDFGTSNSTVAVATSDGLTLLPLPGPAGDTPTWRTVRATSMRARLRLRYIVRALYP